MQTVLEAVAERLMGGDESLIRIPEICRATGVNYGSVYHHFGSREGVIDAAYNLLFLRFVEGDVTQLALAVRDTTTFDEYVTAVLPFIGLVSAGEDRRARRAMRARIVAAATIRPRLGQLIGQTQEENTRQLMEVARWGQERGWVRRDQDAKLLAVLLQTLFFGRVLDDVSTSPIGDQMWESSMAELLMDLLTPS